MKGSSVTTPTATKALSPFQLASYFRDHAPATARRGMRGYILRALIDLARIKGPDRGTCFPSVAYLAEMVGRSVRHVRRCLAELEALGEIKRIYRKNADGGWSSTLYELRGLLRWFKNVRGGADKHGRKSPTERDLTPARGVKSDSKGGQAAPPCSAPPTAPVAVTGQGLEKSEPVGTFSAQYRSTALGGHSTASPVKSRKLTAAQIEEAKAKCDPARWARLLIDAGTDGATGDDLAEGAARRWRADAIMRGLI